MQEDGTKDDTDALEAGGLLDEEVVIQSRPEASRPTGLSATFRALRHRNYRLYFFGQFVSLIGTWMQNAALTWLAFDITRESKWSAGVSAAQILPTFLLGIWSGALADYLPKRSLIFGTQASFMALAFLLAWMTFGNAIEPWQLLLVTAAGGIVQAIDLPARLAFVMDMTSREDLGNAVALNAMLFNGARIIGPALTGMVLLWMKPWSCFLANGLSYIAVLGALACMTVPTTTGSSHHKRGARYMLDGFVYLARQRDLLFLVLLMTATSLFAWPFLPLLPALARHELGASDADYGFIYGLTLSGTGVGAVIAAWAVATFGSLPNGRRFIGTGVALVSIGLVCLSAAPNIPLAICFSGMIGCGLIMFLSKSQSVVQLSASDHNRGRIMGIWAMTQSGAIPLGGLLFGHAADRWGVSAVLRFQGLACAGTAALLALAFSAWKLWNVKAADPARAEQPS